MNPQTIPVLLYHSVDGGGAGAGTWGAVTWPLFCAHVDAITASGRTAVTVDRLAAGLRGEAPLPERPVAVSFDDGYGDTLAAVEHLLTHGISASVYVSAGSIGAEGRISRSDVACLAGLPNVMLGAHGVGHAHLDELLPADVARELRDSRAHLEDLARVPVDSFAYPHGAYDRSVRRAVAAAGYRSAVAVKNAFSHPEDDVYAIARLTVMHSTSAGRVTALLDGRGADQARARERLRTRAYRTARRSRRRLQRRSARC